MLTRTVPGPACGAAAAHAYAVIHKGYIATPTYDAAAGVYRARADGLTRDVIAAEGATAHEAAMRFWRAVGGAPPRPLKGPRRPKLDPH